MNKFILFLMLPLLSFTLTGCDEEDEVKPIDLNLFIGTWEVVDQGSQALLERNCILDITSSQIHESFGGYLGYITTYFPTVDGSPVHDRVFSWSIREIENHRPLLNLVFQGELDSDDIWAGDYQYIITKLDYDNMWWQVNTNGDNSKIMFRRRNDFRLE